MVRVIGFDPETLKQFTCCNCGAIVEYQKRLSAALGLLDAECQAEAELNLARMVSQANDLVRHEVEKEARNCRDMFCKGSVSWNLLNERLCAKVEEDLYRKVTLEDLK